MDELGRSCGSERRWSDYRNNGRWWSDAGNDGRRRAIPEVDCCADRGAVLGLEGRTTGLE